MFNARPAVTGILLSVALLGGCASLTDAFSFFGGRDPAGSADALAGDMPYGVESSVRETIDMVKQAGSVTNVTSHGIRLPSRPLSAITAFDYVFPETCGGHRFRVYEVGETQILEFEYPASGGRRYLIRDYISGPGPFIAPGLWTAYDHTEESLDGMHLQVGTRGSGILRGTYSQGPVTGLARKIRHTLGRAYDEALRDTARCRG